MRKIVFLCFYVDQLSKCSLDSLKNWREPISHFFGHNVALESAVKWHDIKSISAYKTIRFAVEQYRISW